MKKISSLARMEIPPKTLLASFITLASVNMDTSKMFPQKIQSPSICHVELHMQKVGHGHTTYLPTNSDMTFSVKKGGCIYRDIALIHVVKHNTNPWRKKVCNEYGLAPKGKMYSGLCRNTERQAEMTCPALRASNKRMFNSAKVLHDQFVPAGEMEFLTSKYVKAVFHQNDYFSVDPFIQPTNQRVLSSHIWTTMNLQFVTLRQHARRTGITNA